MEQDQKISMYGEFTTEKGFLDDLDKRTFITEKETWVDGAYVKELEERFGKMVTITRDALRLASISREKLKKMEEIAENCGSENLNEQVDILDKA